jgi:hypothetical protein
MDKEETMRILTVAVLAVAALVVGVAALNWAAIVAPGTLSLGITNVQAPLGLTLLVLMGALAGLLALHGAMLQGSALMDARRLSKEVLASRDLADKAEASRFTELRAYMEALEARQREVIEQTGNSLAASVGQLEDKVDRVLGGQRG